VAILGAFGDSSDKKNPKIRKKETIPNRASQTASDVCILIEETKPSEKVCERKCGKKWHMRTACMHPDDVFVSGAPTPR
jgi:hypothetical protein